MLGGHLAFDVRVNGKVTRIKSADPVKGRFKVEAVLTGETMTLTVDGSTVARGDSPGLIPVQPKDGLDVGRDDLTAAGDYPSPNPFRGKIHAVQVTPREPDEAQ
jgi:arylsulfatase